MQTRTNILNRLRNSLFSVSATSTPYQHMLSEAKEEGFDFSVYEGDRAYVVSAENAEIFLDRIELTTGEKTYIIKYSQLTEIQTRLKTKTFNLILREKQTLRELGLLFIPTLLALVAFVFYRQLAKFVPQDPEWVVLIMGFVVLFVSYFFIFASTSNTQRKLQEIRLRAVSAGRAQTVIRQLEKAADDEQKYFSALIINNVNNIARYYSLVEEQANKSYQLTKNGASAGFGLLLAGIGLSFFRGADQPSTVLTIASGVLIEFISAVFFYLYNSTIRELNKYHDKLIKVQDKMLALRVAQGITNDDVLKNQTSQYLIRALTRTLDERAVSNDLSNTPETGKNS